MMTLSFSLIIAIAITSIYAHNKHHNHRDSKWFMTDLVKSKLHSILQSDECSAPWPNSMNCVEWFVDEDEGLRYVITNSIPPFKVDPYCPFGVGLGYCLPAGATNCTQFYGLVCPAQPNAPSDGDVEVPQIVMYAFNMFPDPTNDSKPMNLYELNPMQWWYLPNSENEQIINHKDDHYAVQKFAFSEKHLFDFDDIPRHNPMNAVKVFGAPPPPNPTFQTIGVHMAGIQIKGPAEAEGYNVDAVDIPLKCGGHTSTCLMEGNVSSGTSHSALVGYANDGFGIYGFYDLNGAQPIVDECNGHFGCLDDECKEVSYHYHAYNYTYSGKGQFRPYWTGCLGPSKGQCNSTVHEQYDNGANWCGEGCGYEICVQEGTNENTLQRYIDSFGDINWMKQFTVNPF